MRGGFCSLCNLQLTGRLRKYCRDHSRQASTLLKRQYRRDEKAKGPGSWRKEWAKKSEEECKAYFRNYRRAYRRRKRQERRMTHGEDASTICPVCRAFWRFKVRVAQIEETPSRCGEIDRLFTTGCWIVAALERTYPCGAHRKTLREAQSLTKELAKRLEEEKEGSWIQE